MEKESKYKKIEKLGEGAYGAVYKAQDLNTNQIVALKVSKLDSNDEGFPSTSVREISILKSLNHKFIIK
jgi:serine/threonine protein kinase